MPKCIYCKTALPDDSVLDVCRRCGIGVWGENMYNAILKNMGDAKESGNLYQGSITQTPSKEINAKPKPTSTMSASDKAKLSIISDAMNQLEKTEKDEIRYDSYNKSA